MIFKIIGAILIIAGCGGFSFLMVYSHRRQVHSLEQFIGALDYIYSELQYNLTPLPELTQKVIGITTGPVRTVFQAFLEEINNQISQDAEKCMFDAIKKVKDIPNLTKNGFESFGRTLGKLDLEGQQMAVAALRDSCAKKLEVCTNNQDVRLRSYQTLGLCAGAALAILFV